MGGDDLDLGPWSTSFNHIGEEVYETNESLMFLLCFRFWFCFLLSLASELLLFFLFQVSDTIGSPAIKPDTDPTTLRETGRQ